MNIFGNILPFIVIILIFYYLIVKPQEKLKKEQEEQRLRILNMSIGDILIENGLKEYCKIFEENKIDTLKTAMDLTDMDLINMGISVIGVRKKILLLIEEKKTIIFQNNVNSSQQNTVVSNQDITIHHSTKRGQDASTGFGRAFGETTGTAAGIFTVILVILLIIIGFFILRSYGIISLWNG